MDAMLEQRLIENKSFTKFDYSIPHVIFVTCDFFNEMHNNLSYFVSHTKNNRIEIVPPMGYLC